MISPCSLAVCARSDRLSLNYKNKQRKKILTVGDDPCQRVNFYTLFIWQSKEFRRESVRKGPLIIPLLEI